MKRHFCYVTGTRADFGLMEGTLRRIHAHQQLALSVCVTGMHLSPLHGNTVTEVEHSGLRICGRIPVSHEKADGATMAAALAHVLLGLIPLLQQEKPDAVILLGDRGEMLAGAIAAIHLNIPVVHVHGGERSGTVDEPVRHAISKLAHYHFTATVAARERLIRMGEGPAHVFVTGAPGLDGITDAPRRSRAELCAGLGLDSARPVALLLYHPVLQTADAAGREMAEVLAAVQAAGVQVVCLTPNADAGNRAIREEIARVAQLPGFRVATHFSRPDYLSWLAAADVMVGNSSSGIIEAASFGLPVVNVGNRQQGRERNVNTTDVLAEWAAIHTALTAALSRGRQARQNVYGDGQAAERIIELLSTLPFPQDLLNKSNAY
ncbi:MAG: UDP-N-acetylglucosamine 2-epimerase [Opitutaceae bacterium]